MKRFVTILAILVAGIVSAQTFSFGEGYRVRSTDGSLNNGDLVFLAQNYVLTGDTNASGIGYEIESTIIIQLQENSTDNYQYGDWTISKIGNRWNGHADGGLVTLLLDTIEDVLLYIINNHGEQIIENEIELASFDGVDIQINDSITFTFAGQDPIVFDYDDDEYVFDGLYIIYSPAPLNSFNFNNDYFDTEEELYAAVKMHLGY